MYPSILTRHLEYKGMIKRREKRSEKYRTILINERLLHAIAQAIALGSQ